MTVVGSRVRSLDGPALSAAVTDLVDAVTRRFPSDGPLVLVPDTHYPYHPSTGMVTNPAVVDALLRALDTYSDGVEPVVAIAGSDAVDPARVASYLGYDDIAERLGVDLRYLHADATEGGDDSVGAELSNGDRYGNGDGVGSTSSAVPSLLREHPVVTVPSVRLGEELVHAGSIATLARAAGVDLSNLAEVYSVLSHVTPVAGVADATYTYTGDPYKARALFAATDQFALDRAIATVLDVGPAFEDALGRTWHGDGPAVSGVDMNDLAAEIPGGSMPPADDVHPVLRAGYRAYSTVTGDIYPPHMEADR